MAPVNDDVHNDIFKWCFLTMTFSLTPCFNDFVSAVFVFNDVAMA